MRACLDETTVVDYLQGWLSEPERQEYEDHIDTCERCRALLSEVVRGSVDGGEEYQLGDELVAGTLIEHFQVKRLLGRGRMGEVYLCRDTQLGRRVALKVVRPDSLGSPAAVERFLQEARTTARFNHPHIVTIHSAGVWRGLPYLALEYLEGQTLRRRMDAEQLSVRESMRFALAIAEALEEAHRHKVLHRDLKPANVMLPRDGRLRVLDFSLAKILPAGAASPAPEIDPRGETVSAPQVRLPSTDDLGDEALTSENGVICGTPTYMAPEQWLARSPSAATDVWALGVILYELLQGERPYKSRSMLELRSMVVAAAPVPAVTGDDEVALPEALGALVNRCLAKDPGLRPTAAQVVQTLEQLLAATLERRRSDAEQSPFRGLLPFDERHAEAFFGREAEVAAFIERLRDQAVLPVVGPSGAGKTSFVQAGVVPRLREQGEWIVLQLRPGDTPFANLAARLERGESTIWSASEGGTGLQMMAGEDRAAVLDRRQRRESAAVDDLPLALATSPLRLNLELRQLAERWGSRVLLFVDQLEELCTQAPSETEAQREEQAAFMRALCGAGDDPHDPVRVVFTLRDDFLGQLPGGQRVRDALGHVMILRSPDERALQEIVTRPLSRRGYRYDEADLPARMVEEVRGEAAALPLLQFATQMLWDRRDPQERLLLRAVYDEMGGVAGALARHADSLLEGLPDAEVRLARELLLHLVTPAGTRRAVPRTRLLEGLGQAAGAVLDRLVSGRLLSVRRNLGTVDGLPHEGEDGAASSGEARLELAHESLLRGWARLARWIEESREELIALSELSQAAELWERRGARPEEVWGGEALQEGLRTVERASQTVPRPVRRFLELGQRRQERRRRLRRWQLAAGMALLVLVAVVALLVALSMSRQKRQAEHQRAEAQREGAQAALLRGEMLEARAKLRGSLETRDSALTRLLWWRLSRAPLLWRRTLGAPVNRVAFAPDGRLLAVGGADRSIYLFDTHTFNLRRQLRGHTDQVLSLGFAPDGRALASGSWSGEVKLWRTDGEGGGVTLGRHAGAVWCLAYSPDGKRLATGSYDSKIRIWDPARRRLVRTLSGHASGVYGVAFSPDGKLLASGSNDKSVLLWDLAGGGAKPLRKLSGHTATVYRVSFSPGGELLASSGADRTIRLWQPRTGATLRVLREHEAGVGGLAFSPDGALLASGSYDKKVRLWEVRSGRSLVPLTGHTAGIVSVSFSPDGRRLASGSRDRSVRLWDLSRAGRAPSAAGHTRSIWEVSFSPDGKVLASGSRDESLRLWDLTSGDHRVLPNHHVGGVLGVRFSPDGRWLATGGGDSAVRLLELETGKRRIFSGHGSEVYSLAYSPDGKLLASGSYDRTVRLWDVASGQQRQVLRGHTGAIYGVAFSGDGARLASGSYDRAIRIWDVTSGALVKQLQGHGGSVYGLSFSPDGQRLASSSGDKSVRLWDLATGQSKVLRRYKSRVYWADFHKDGRRLAVPVADGTARVLDLRDGSERVFTGHRGEVNFFRFSGDGKLAASSSDDGTVRVWDAATGQPHWRAPLLHDADKGGVWLQVHDGWRRLDASSAKSPPPSRWRTAVQERARFADAAGELLCLGAHVDGGASALELWDQRGDRRIVRRTLPGLKRVLALPQAGGCLALAAGKITRHATTGAAEELARGATAMVLDGGDLLAAVGPALKVIPLKGIPLKGSGATRSYPVDQGVTAAARTPRWVVLGYADGNIELISRQTRKKRRDFSFKDVPASPVERILVGAMETLIVGYANGLLGVWNLRTGRRLVHERLHGPVSHLLLKQGRKLYAATELGRHVVWDLGVLRAERCAVLRDVWAGVPVVWEGGRPVQRAPPAGHECRR